MLACFCPSYVGMCLPFNCQQFIVAHTSDEILQLTYVWHFAVIWPFQHFVVAHIHIALTYAGICLRLNANNILLCIFYWMNCWHLCHLTANMLLLCISILNKFPLACLPFERQHVTVVHIHIERISVGMFAIWPPTSYCCAEILMVILLDKTNISLDIPMPLAKISFDILWP